MHSIKGGEKMNYFMYKCLEQLLTEELKKGISQDSTVSPAERQVFFSFIDACTFYKTLNELFGA